MTGAAGQGPNAGRLRVEWHGRERFAPCLDRQRALREALLAGAGEPTLVLVEHPPVLTLGRRGRRSDILWTDEDLAARGVEVCTSPRGGEVTLHAPGQLVAYPVVYVGKRIRKHIEDLGEVAVRLATEMGVEGAAFRMDHPGVWVGPRKLASIGIHVSRGVTVQGIAINLDVDRSLFSSLVPCGVPGLELVSVADLAGKAWSMERAAVRFAEVWAERTGVEIGTVAGFEESVQIPFEVCKGSRWRQPDGGMEDGDGRR